MSIIYEALKKVEEGKDAFVQKKVPKSLVKFSQNAKKRFPWTGNKSFLLAGVTFATLAVLFLFIKALNTGGSSGQDVTSAVKISESSQVYEKLGPAGETLTKVASDSNIGKKYSLEGIVYDEGAALAVINGIAVRELEKLDNFMVTTIDPDKVEMIDSDKNLKLTLSF